MAGFSIGAKGYLGTGISAGEFKAFWEYDTASGVDVDEINFENYVSVYPNPAINIFHLSINNWQSKKMQIEIFDVLGESIYKSEIHKSEEEINVSNLPSGVYYLKIYSEGKSAVKKFVKL